MGSRGSPSAAEATLCGPHQSLTMDNEVIRTKVIHITLPGESSLRGDGRKSELPGNGELIHAPLRDDPQKLPAIMGLFHAYSCIDGARARGPEKGGGVEVSRAASKRR